MDCCFYELIIDCLMIEVCFEAQLWMQLLLKNKPQPLHEDSQPLS